MKAYVRCHEVSSVQTVEIVTAEVVDVWTVHSVSKAHTLEESSLGINDFTTLLPKSYAVSTQGEFDGQPASDGSSSNHQTIEWSDVWVGILNLAQVTRIIDVTPCWPTPGQEIQVLVNLGPFPFASITNQGSNLLIRHGGVGIDIVVVILSRRRWSSDRLDNNVLHDGVICIELIPKIDDIFPLAPRARFFGDGILHLDMKRLGSNEIGQEFCFLLGDLVECSIIDRRHGYDIEILSSSERYK